MSALPMLNNPSFALPTERIDESFWALVKEQFVIRPGYIMLNAANLCPSPHMVRDTVSRMTDDLDGDVSFQSRAKFSEMREASRQKIATLLGVDENEIALVRNTSEGNNIVASGLSLSAGDEVVLFEQNHPTNSVAWDVSAARQGFVVKRVQVPSPPEDPDQIMDLFTAAISPRTKVLAFSDLSNSTGVQMPTQQLCQLARARGIYSHVDGAQTFGVKVRDLHALGCDSYSASGHKWFMGPKETGVLYVRQDRIEQIWASDVGIGWGNAVETSAKGARKFETLGQRDDAALAAVGTAVDFINLIGIEQVEHRVQALAHALKEGMQAIPSAKMVTSMAAELSGGVCIAIFEGKDQSKIFNALYQDHGIAGAPTGGIRLCPHIYTTMADITKTIEALERVVGNA